MQDVHMPSAWARTGITSGGWSASLSGHTQGTQGSLKLTWPPASPRTNVTTISVPKGPERRYKPSSDIASEVWNITFNVFY